MTALGTKFTPGFQLSNADGDLLDGIVATVNEGGSASGALVATGSTRADALALPSKINNFTSVGSGTGAELPAASTVSGSPLNPVVVLNGGASSLTVYAPGSNTIDGSAGSSGVPLSAGGRCQYIAVTSGGFVSAQLGVASA